MDSFSNLNKQRRAGDNLFVYSMVINRGDDEIEPRWSEKTFSFGYLQHAQHHTYTNGRERIYGDPPSWLKEADDELRDATVIKF